MKKNKKYRSEVAKEMLLDRQYLPKTMPNKKKRERTKDRQRTKNKLREFY